MTEGNAAARIALAMLVVAFFVALGAAFWKRSWLWGLAVLNAGTLLKVIWSVTFGGEAGWASLMPDTDRGRRVSRDHILGRSRV